MLQYFYLKLTIYNAKRKQDGLVLPTLSLSSNLRAKSGILTELNLSEAITGAVSSEVPVSVKLDQKSRFYGAYSGLDLVTQYHVRECRAVVELVEVQPTSTTTSLLFSGYVKGISGNEEDAEIELVSISPKQQLRLGFGGTPTYSQALSGSLPFVVVGRDYFKAQGEGGFFHCFAKPRDHVTNGFYGRNIQDSGGTRPAYQYKAVGKSTEIFDFRGWTRVGEAKSSATSFSGRPANSSYPQLIHSATTMNTTDPNINFFNVSGGRTEYIKTVFWELSSDFSNGDRFRRAITSLTLFFYKNNNWNITTSADETTSDLRVEIVAAKNIPGRSQSRQLRSALSSRNVVVKSEPITFPNADLSAYKTINDLFFPIKFEFDKLFVPAINSDGSFIFRYYIRLYVENLKKPSTTPNDIFYLNFTPTGVTHTILMRDFIDNTDDKKVKESDTINVYTNRYPKTEFDYLDLGEFSGYDGNQNGGLNDYSISEESDPNSLSYQDVCGREIYEFETPYLVPSPPGESLKQFIKTPRLDAKEICEELDLHIYNEVLPRTTQASPGISDPYLTDIESICNILYLPKDSGGTQIIENLRGTCLQYDIRNLRFRDLYIRWEGKQDVLQEFNKIFTYAGYRLVKKLQNAATDVYQVYEMAGLDSSITPIRPDYCRLVKVEFPKEPKIREFIFELHEPIEVEGISSNVVEDPKNQITTFTFNQENSAFLRKIYKSDPGTELVVSEPDAKNILSLDLLVFLQAYRFADGFCFVDLEVDPAFAKSLKIQDFVRISILGFPKKGGGSSGSEITSGPGDEITWMKYQHDAISLVGHVIKKDVSISSEKINTIVTIETSIDENYYYNHFYA